MNQSGKAYWLRSGAFSFMERIGMQVLRFGSFYLLVRCLSKSDFGVWTLFTLLSYLSVTLSGGLIQRALVRTLLLDEAADQQRAIQTASLFLHVFVSLAIMLALGLLAQVAPYIWETEQLGSLLSIHIVMTLTFIPLLQSQYVLQAHMRFEGIFFSTMTRQAIILGYISYRFFFADRVVDMSELAWCYVIATGSAAGVATAFAVKHIQIGRKLSFLWVKRLLRFGSFSTGTQISYVIMRTIDQLMVGAMVSASAVAGYGAAVRVANLVEVPTQSMGNILFPQSARQLQQKGPGAVRNLYEKSVGFILALIIPGGLLVWLMPERILLLVAGPNYVDMVDVLRVALLAGLLIPFLRQFTTIMESIGKPHLNFSLMAGGVVLYIGIVYLSILFGGTLGAAFGVLGSFLIIVGSSFWLLHQELGVRPWRPAYYMMRVYRRGFLVLGKFLVSGKLKI